ncbi:MAG: YicC/YloC family endoribonuclease [Planctomycetota bacterium]|jgi:uncharacterized protein (TIGR00255 family)
MLSMTGHGSAVLRAEGLDVEVELRSVNHRFFNLKIILPGSLAAHERDVEQMVRGRIARGSVTLAVSLKQAARGGPALPDPKVIRSAYRRLRKVQKDLKIPGELTMEALLGLPHLWTGNGNDGRAARLWPRVRALIRKALEDHRRMRVREGKGIHRDISRRLKRIEDLTVRIRKFSASVPAHYQKRLLDRVNQLTAQHGPQVARADVAREVAVYADRCDISEELQRIRSHCRQFRKILGRPGQIGRKLDFLTQEMAREANTLAAKGGDSRISALAVEIKAEIEKIREQSENVE